MAEESTDQQEDSGSSGRNSADRDYLPEAFDLFYKHASGMVFRAMLVATNNRVHAEDATATAFTRAFRQWDRVALHPNPTAWVLRVARNAYLSSFRQWESRWAPDPPDSPEPEPELNLSIDPQVVAAVLALSKRQREVLALRDLAELTTAETAEVLGIAPGTVTAHLHRAHESLRKALGESWGSGECYG